MRRPLKVGKNFGDSTIAPTRSITSGSARGTVVPKIRIRPESGRTRPSSILIVVVLPDPFGPRKPCTPCAGTRRSRPSTAGRPR